jgi:hypothetical protein
MTKSRSGAAQARKPAAMRRASAPGGASRGAVARASNAPERACVSVSMPEAIASLCAGYASRHSDKPRSAYSSLQLDAAILAHERTKANNAHSTVRGIDG